MDREYGVETRIPFTLYEADGINLRTDAVYVAGDVKISKDEGSPVNTTNGFVAVNGKYYIILASTEMQAARISLTIIDQDGTKLWLDIGKDIETYGNASAQHAFNQNSAEVTTDSASQTGSKADVSGLSTQASVDDLPTNAEFEARTKPTADYFDPAVDEVESGHTYREMISDTRAAGRGDTTNEGTVFKKADGTTTAFTTSIIGGNRTNT
ncbi:MAG: hypothetical protein GY804_04570 [Alphaproteobacteria bacterium]|nr:hypothetical protein [Alphaproteobacteria bacterium]